MVQKHEARIEQTARSDKAVQVPILNGENVVRYRLMRIRILGLWHIARLLHHGSAKPLTENQQMKIHQRKARLEERKR